MPSETRRTARIRALAEAAKVLPASERTAFVAASCGNDDRLLADVLAFFGDAEKPTIELSARLSSPAGTDDPDRPDRPENRIGEFRLLRVIGRGAMGTVYEAYQPSMNRHVAVKILGDTFSDGHIEQSRFEHEAWIAGRLSHPNIVRAYGQGLHGNTRYLVMECLSGDSLQAETQALKRQNCGPAAGGDRVRQMLNLFIDVADALDYIHRQGVVHRDIKPSNLLFADDKKRLLLSDFGIALDRASTRLTQRGDFLGTVCYMSPEQLLASRIAVDHRSDIWSFGVTLYEALTLTLPFSGDTEQAYMTAVHAKDPMPARARYPALPRDLETVLMKCLEKDADRRYTTAGEIRDELSRVLRDEPVQARRRTAWYRSARFIRRERRVIAAIALTSVLVLAAWSSILYWLGKRHNDAFLQGALVQLLNNGGAGVREGRIWRGAAPLPIFFLRRIRLIQVNLEGRRGAFRLAWPAAPAGSFGGTEAAGMPEETLVPVVFCSGNRRESIAKPVLAAIDLLGTFDLDAEVPLAADASLELNGKPVLAFPLVFGRGEHSFQIAGSFGGRRHKTFFRGVFAVVDPSGTTLEGRTLGGEFAGGTTLAGRLSLKPSAELAKRHSFQQFRQDSISFSVPVDIITTSGEPVVGGSCRD